MKFGRGFGGTHKDGNVIGIDGVGRCKDSDDDAMGVDGEDVGKCDDETGKYDEPGKHDGETGTYDDEMCGKDAGEDSDGTEKVAVWVAEGMASDGYSTGGRQLVLRDGLVFSSSSPERLREGSTCRRLHGFNFFNFFKALQRC